MQRIWKILERMGYEMTDDRLRDSSTLWCCRRRADGKPQSTGLWHLDGFESLHLKQKQDTPGWGVLFLVRAAGFEPTVSWSQTKRDTKLR